MKFLTRQSRSKKNKKNKETPSTIEDEKKDTDENDTGLRLDSPSKDASSDIDIQKYENSLKSTEYDSYDESYSVAPPKRSLLYKKQPDHSFNGEVYYEDFGERAHSIMKTRYFDTIPFLQNDHDTVIKVEASTVSLWDVMIRNGMWTPTTNTNDHIFKHRKDDTKIKLPCIPGFDLVGTIYKCGANVEQETNLKLRDRVAALVRVGGNARYVRVPSQHLVKVPWRVDPTDAVCMVNTYMTAYQALHGRRVGGSHTSVTGKTVFIFGGDTLVGQACIQLAILANAERIYATARKENKNLVTKYDEHVIFIPLNENDWEEELFESMDIVIDTINHYATSTYNYDESTPTIGLMLCKREGRFTSIRNPLMAESPLKFPLLSYEQNHSSLCSSVLDMLSHNHDFCCESSFASSSTYDIWESFCNDPDMFKEDLKRIFQYVKNKAISPRILRRVGLRDVVKAHESLQNGNITHSHIVCTPFIDKMVTFDLIQNVIITGPTVTNPDPQSKNYNSKSAPLEHVPPVWMMQQSRDDMDNMDHSLMDDCDNHPDAESYQDANEWTLAGQRYVIK